MTLKIEQPVILFHILMKNGKYWEEFKRRNDKVKRFTTFSIQKSTQ